MEITEDQTLQMQRSVNLKKQQKLSKTNHKEKKRRGENMSRESIRGLWDGFEHPNIPVTGVSRKERAKGIKKTSEESLAENFPNFMKARNPQIQKPQLIQGQET